MQLLALSDWGSESRLYVNRYRLWASSLVPKVKPGAIVYEFGVGDGTATNWMARQNLPLTEWHGFDTFTGLPTPWSRGGVDVMEAGVFNQSKNKSEYPNVEAKYPLNWHKGLILQKLVSEKFPISLNKQKILLIDVDLYEPTKEILEYFAKHLRTGDLIYFDEGFDSWNEGRALQETLNLLPSLTCIAHTGSALLIEVKSNNE
jgi:hypothetical protein